MKQTSVPLESEDRVAPAPSDLVTEESRSVAALPVDGFEPLESIDARDVHVDDGESLGPGVADGLGVEKVEELE